MRCALCGTLIPPESGGVYRCDSKTDEWIGWHAPFERYAPLFPHGFCYMHDPVITLPWTALRQVIVERDGRRIAECRPW